VGDDRPSRSGHGADRITELLTSPLMIGDGEQYAVAASLMAQDIGFPARVVLGFADGSAGGAGSTGGTATFRGSDLTARVEVDTAQYGWVLLDPNPPVRAIPQEQQRTPQPVARPETVVPPPPPAQQDQDTQHPPQTDRARPPVVPLWLQVLLAAVPWAIGTLAVLALVSLPFAVVLALKRIRRRRRRRAPSPRLRVVGAWEEYRDVLLDHGVAVGVSATRHEISAVAPGQAGAALAMRADQAVFGPTEVDAAAADGMWIATDAAVGDLSAGRTRRERFRDATSLRSFRRSGLARSGGGGRGTSWSGLSIRYDGRGSNEDRGHP
jgi:hypothetical protein